METNELAEPGRSVQFLFINRAGYDPVYGKAGYPACLMLRLNRRDALELAESLVRFGRSLDENEPAFSEFANFYGTLQRLPEE